MVTIDGEEEIWMARGRRVKQKKRKTFKVDGNTFCLLNNGLQGEEDKPEEAHL